MSVWRSVLRFFGRRDPPESTARSPVATGPYRHAAPREENAEGGSGSSPEADIMRAALGPPPPRGHFRSYIDEPAPVAPGEPCRSPHAPPLAEPATPVQSYADPAPDDGFNRLTWALADAAEKLDDLNAAICFDAELTRDAMIDAGLIPPTYPEPRNTEEAEERAIMRALSVDTDE